MSVDDAAGRSNPASDDLRQLTQAVRGLLAAGRVVDAESTLWTAARRRGHDAAIGHLLADFYLANQRPDLAADALRRCIDAAPSTIELYFELAAVLDDLGRHDEIVRLFEQLCTARPALAVAHFNHAVYLRRSGRAVEALAAYQRAIDAGLDNVAEAWSNVGVILGDLDRHDEARAAFANALAADARWVPAVYNLGLLHEEFGDRDAAVERFRQVLDIDPDYHEALARLIHATAVTHADEPLLVRARTVLARSGAAATRESVLFALGKGLDECGDYAGAFAAFSEANASARARFGGYDRTAAERNDEAIRSSFGGDWLARAEPVSMQPMVFVCGVWRSGTTLLERMLAAHPALTGGGEISYFDAAMNPALAADPRAMAALGRGYLELLRARFAGADRVVDKRPDNFRHLGLLAGLFPGARFIAMQRDALDTCVSVFFQQLGEELCYATDLSDIAHYLVGYRRLLRHWQALFPERILEVHYEQLVRDPEHQLRRVCEFLGLPWAGEMLDFATRRERVRTASVWQVREGAHTRSIGRAGRYTAHLEGAVSVLRQAGELR